MNAKLLIDKKSTLVSIISWDREAVRRQANTRSNNAHLPHFDLI